MEKKLIYAFVFLLLGSWFVIGEKRSFTEKLFIIFAIISIGVNLYLILYCLEWSPFKDPKIITYDQLFRLIVRRNQEIKNLRDALHSCQILLVRHQQSYQLQ